MSAESPPQVCPRRRLILVRHGESVFNAQDRFTGRTDVELTARGVREAQEVGRLLRDAGLDVDLAFSSALTRAVRSAQLILAAMGRAAGGGAGAGGVALVEASALNERDYGDLTGLDKQQARARFGEAQVRRWRRSYAEAPPNGESLRDTVARVAAYYVQEVLPAVLRGRSVLLVAHGNTLRALALVLDRLTAEEVAGLEFATGDVIAYELAADSTIAARRTLRSR